MYKQTLRKLILQSWLPSTMVVIILNTSLVLFSLIKKFYYNVRHASKSQASIKFYST